MPDESTPAAVQPPVSGSQPGSGGARSIVSLVADGTLDAELAGLVWLLLEARVPIVVAGLPGSGRTTLLDALLAFLPPGRHLEPLARVLEHPDWLPIAPELGWRPPAAGTPRPGGAPDPATTVIHVPEIAPGVAEGAWGATARTAIRAIDRGFGLATTIAGDRLEDVFERLRAGPNLLSEDELTLLGVVLIARRLEPGRHRVVAAHYVRPIVRDAHGHVQRMPPAVLAVHDPDTDRFEHFAWGIAVELAGRCGRRPVAFEREQARRATYLADLAAAGITAPGPVRTAILGGLEAPGRPA